MSDKKSDLEPLKGPKGDDGVESGEEEVVDNVSDEQEQQEEEEGEEAKDESPKTPATYKSTTEYIHPSFEIEKIFHVTKSKTIKNTIAEVGFLPYSANDVKYDGFLAKFRDNFKGVFFTASLYMNDLPTITMYPRDGVNGQKYPRCIIPLGSINMAKYHMYLVKKPTNTGKYLQIHLVFIPKENKDAIEICLKQNGRKLDKTNNEFFVIDKGTETWYALNMDQDKTVLNLFFVADNPNKYMTFDQMEWDEVAFIKN